MVSVYFPNNLIDSELTFGERKQHSHTEWSRTASVNDGICRVQVQKVKVLFGVMSYKDPNTKEDAPARYSTAICMSEKGGDAEELKKIIEKFEDEVQKKYGQKDLKFLSTIKTNDKGLSHLRIKIPPTIQVYNEDSELTEMGINDLKKRCVHGIYVDMILQLNYVWCSGNKYGVSWKLYAIKIPPTIQEELKKVPPPKIMVRSFR